MSYFFPGISGMCPPLSRPSRPQSPWTTSPLGFLFCALNTRKAPPAASRALPFLGCQFCLALDQTVQGPEPEVWSLSCL